ncbi:MAG: hypothetical protein CBE24_03950 [bacterium TMED264]|nr:MAG: hypothetical protein CBE24_03950 [bacterium TMED264]|tara:strand:+ start:210 stop:638 length:429 start_codon:yes stop_codon:yes gene_type:complete
MKNLFYLPILFFFFIQACVGPPDYSDGLLENNPAVINEADYFSLSIFGDKYTEKIEWNLLFSSNPTASLLTTLITKDVNTSSTDSTFLLLMNELGDTVMNAFIGSEIIFTSLDSLSSIGTPSRVVLESDNFNGRLEYQIIIN